MILSRTGGSHRLKKCGQFMMWRARFDGLGQPIPRGGFRAALLALDQNPGVAAEIRGGYVLPTSRIDGGEVFMGHALRKNRHVHRLASGGKIGYCRVGGAERRNCETLRIQPVFQGVAAYRSRIAASHQTGDNCRLCGWV